ncbi:malate dehydrogenase (oxaloacetate-decarboxylating) [Nakamurella panacisegetis]|uniref:Malate dehydrogenase (Oxaloacetate-decarboxylating) n=1 Tax=Nakamurella panacisegetis TaxID=1090615 RepID=A0A1H0J7T0_9ACTN|nr:NAD-dependent malic enzyme [Nakamurella panacisegetis]SDO39590.1 malate dehydrogenase (oxaloacetate-decarboxylating) [Nakamurella panacisegetis]
MAIPGPGYSITMRIAAPPSASAAGDLTSAVGRAGGVITAFDVVESAAGLMVVDLSANALSADHADEITDAVNALPGVTVRKVSDRTFLVHLGGKIEVTSKVPLRNRDDLSRAYTPGVARVCMAIAENPDDARRLTIKRNTVAVVTDGTAVLGLGNIGPAAALPVMEGKAALFKKFAGVDAWPVCIDSTDTEEIIRTVQLIAPVYGGINLEDIAAPRCFEIERRLRELLDIPVFHDDQHGTAIVVVAALRNALRVVKKDIRDCRIVVSGVGAAGNAIIRLLLHQDPADIVAVDIKGIVHRGREGMDPNLAEVASRTNKYVQAGSIHDAIVGADVFIGVSAPNILTGADIEKMNSDAIVFALANPDPEVDPIEAQQHAAVVATGRSDFPNQINNVLAFPGVFRGLLDAQARMITDEMLTAAALAIADVVAPDQLNASYIVPSVFDEKVAKAVARAVVAAARDGQHVAGGAKESAATS